MVQQENSGLLASQSNVCSFPAVVAYDSRRKIRPKKKKKVMSFVVLLDHRELCSMLCVSLDGRGVWGRMDLCICAAASICCPPEIITTLLIVQYKIKKKIFFLSDEFCLKW